MSTQLQPGEAVLASWLHISDIHFGHGSASHQWDQKLVMSELRRDITETLRDGRLPEPEYVFVTGDISFSGGSKIPTSGLGEYVLAAQWLDDTIGDLGLTREHVFVVPGNHDVDRTVDKSDQDIARLVKTTRESIESIDEVLAHPANIERLQSRMSRFQEFSRLFGSERRQQFHGGLWWRHDIVLMNGITLRLCGLNTSLLCVDDKDKGRLAVGNQQLSDLLVPAPHEQEITMVLSHHPFSGNWLSDETSVSGRFNREDAIHLFGHIHEASSEQARSGRGASGLQIAAGAAHAEAAVPGAPPTGHGYNIGALVRLEGGNLAVRLWPRRWSSKSPRFIVDTDNINEQHGYAEHILSRPASPRSRSQAKKINPRTTPKNSTAPEVTNEKTQTNETLQQEELRKTIITTLTASGYSATRIGNLFSSGDAVLAEKTGVAFPDNLYIVISALQIDDGKSKASIAAYEAFKTQDSEARCILVSEVGFTPSGRSRASKARVHCWTHLEFRRKFVATAAYEELVLGEISATTASVDSPSLADPNLEPPLWSQIRDLEAVYQDPHLMVPKGGRLRREGSAIAWFDQWLAAPSRQWVSLIGDYGSGKTALTKMLLARWMRAYQVNNKFLPIRIELRDFATKFDLEGLIIHFWRKHSLDAMPLRTLEMLIEEGRVVFILDGFDEMAQNLSLLDRRNCLTALAKAISGRSSGIITSRPNYFTEAEELRVVELLYHRSGSIQRLDQLIALEEEKVDRFLQRHYLERQEVRLLDLTPQQIEDLLSARLSKEPQLRANVKDIIKGIYGLERTEPSSDGLASKPVVITYLLEVAENLDSISLAGYRPLDAWGIYQLILDKLVMRDQARTSGIVLPSERRTFLQRLAAELSIRRLPHANQSMMLRHVTAIFGREINRLGDNAASSKEDLFFTDLRSSASLTSNGELWHFSHASLREFLVAEYIVETVVAGDSLSKFSGLVPSSGVIGFLASSFDHHPGMMDLLGVAYVDSPEVVLNLFIPAVLARGSEVRSSLLSKLVPGHRVSNVHIFGVTIQGVSFSDWRFEDVAFDHCIFKDCTFSGCRFQRIEFTDCTMTRAIFTNGEVEKCDFDGVTLERCSMKGFVVRGEGKILLHTKDEALVGDRARAYLRCLGADIAPGKRLNTWQFGRRWADFEKVMGQLIDGDRGFRQYLGLTQKGGVNDPEWTRGLVDLLVNRGVLEQNEKNGIRFHAESMTAAESFRTGDLPDYLERYLAR